MRRERTETARSALERWWAALVVLAASGFLLARLAPDVHGKPLFEDEAVVGQIAVHGVVSVVRTVIWDRGGAPLHFVLAHVVLTADGSVWALRWLSVVAAVATVPVAFDLGRRVGGREIGALAAVVCASSRSSRRGRRSRSPPPAHGCCRQRIPTGASCSRWWGSSPSSRGGAGLLAWRCPPSRSWPPPRCS
jgi:hypothetical protein